jgi:hypothetical protein
MAGEDIFTADEVKELRRLLEIEKIRKVKNLYSHLMDSRDLEGMAQIYAEDAVGEWGRDYGTWHGRQAIYEQLVKNYQGRKPYDGLHFTTNMWIELTGPTTAISRTYLHDVLTEANPRVNPVIFFAVYDEDFEKISGEWKIKRSRIQFLWPEWLAYDDFPRQMVPTAIG